ncbi:hypothetical protein P691DRAFT_800106 [Macrolepiota fuliginosa MF-IS2]|uniref:Uncharacterized protein n=1 Tax=Macrolepiota fuliginosa MF-IS2 TaxID=1400762 RepID=A0A9P5XQL3_9AGAR|nr:hypothetical protein P691DRAFT_800106 [Macrolepiota fuliginosa MF-IS2]
MNNATGTVTGGTTDPPGIGPSPLCNDTTICNPDYTFATEGTLSHCRPLVFKSYGNTSQPVTILVYYVIATDNNSCMNSLPPSFAGAPPPASSQMSSSTSVAEFLPTPSPCTDTLNAGYKIAIITASVIGGTVVFIVIIVLVYCLGRRSARRSNFAKPIDLMDESAPGSSAQLVNVSDLHLGHGYSSPPMLKTSRIHTRNPVTRGAAGFSNARDAAFGTRQYAAIAPKPVTPGEDIYMASSFGERVVPMTVSESTYPQSASGRQQVSGLDTWSTTSSSSSSSRLSLRSGDAVVVGSPQRQPSIEATPQFILRLNITEAMNMVREEVIEPPPAYMESRTSMPRMALGTQVGL